jgi:hypothetical protein
MFQTVHYCGTQALPRRLILSERHVVLRYERKDVSFSTKDKLRPSLCQILRNLLNLRRLIRKSVIVKFFQIGQ